MVGEDGTGKVKVEWLGRTTGAVGRGSERKEGP